MVVCMPLVFRARACMLACMCRSLGVGSVTWCGSCWCVCVSAGSRWLRALGCVSEMGGTCVEGDRGGGVECVS